MKNYLVTSYSKYNVADTMFEKVKAESSQEALNQVIDDGEFIHEVEFVNNSFSFYIGEDHDYLIHTL